MTTAPKKTRKKPAGNALTAFAKARQAREWSPRTEDPAQVDLEELTAAERQAQRPTGRAKAAADTQAITFRLNKRTHRRLHDVALDLSEAEGRKVYTVEVVERALAAYFRSLGLPEA